MKNIIKKSFITLAIIMASIFSFASLNSAPVLADGDSPTGFSGSCRYILGLTSWDCNVDISSEDTLKTGIWQIVLNIATDITVIAAYLILGYVIYGGYLYIFSGGDPGKVATGKKALYHAFMGLAIVMSANIIMNSIRVALVGANTQLGACDLRNGTNCTDPGIMVISAIQWVTGIAGIIALIFVVYGGISYTTSGGDPGKLQTAKRMILYSLIGLVIVALAQIITAFISSKINESISLTNTPIISKEVINENQIN